MEDTTEAAEGACHCQTQQTSAISRLAAPFFPSWRVFIKYWQKSCCESMAANHCCGSVSIHCLGPWKTPQRQLKARATAKHNKHQPSYPGWLPPFFPSWRVFIKYWQKSCCESTAANHCCGNVSRH